MSLKDLKIKSEYRSLIDNVVQEFYVPLLSSAKCYKRAVGFFSSSSLVEISKGIGTLAKNGGTIQIVASPFLSDEDILAIKKGYSDRNKIIEESLLRQINEEDISSDYYTLERLNLLAALISDGILDIRIAYTENKAGIGMYHEKMGIIEDADGNKVAFSGSMNESATAMSINYETIDVFCNWRGEDEQDRVKKKENAFHSIWNDCEPNIKVLEFPNISQALIDKFRKKTPPRFGIDEEQFGTVAIQDSTLHTEYEHPAGARIPRDVTLREYQKEAIANWVGENYRAIMSMCTGSGKSLTGLGAISKLSEDVQDKLSVIIVCPFQHLVDQWVEDIVRFNIKPIICYSSSPQKDWKKRLERAIRDQRIRTDKSFFCMVCTNATFAGKYVQDQISKMHHPILLVVDEAHNFGSKRLLNLLDDRFRYRLALSATIERHRDEEGTAGLYGFFGKKCIEYSLEDGIRNGNLTPYKYHPVVVHLDEIELGKYEQISYEMGKHIIKGRNGRLKLDKYGEILAIKRSRVVAGASEKISVLRREIQPYLHDNNILVYCGATNVIDETADYSQTDAEDIRQIEAVIKMLGNDLGMKVAKFTSEESAEERSVIKEQFQTADRLQAIVAIKCLDEGVNIPGIKTAFILASTTNPKEYIQRRGRVLRTSPGKSFAEIYDFVTLPRPLDAVSGLTDEQAKRDLSLVKNELARIREFGELSMNSMDSNSLVWDIEEAYHLDENTDLYSTDELLESEGVESSV